MVRIVLDAFTFIDDRPGIFAGWFDLVILNGVSGAQVHDANHVAAAHFHNLTHVLTLNERDFKRYSLSGLQILTPQNLS